MSSNRNDLPDTAYLPTYTPNTRPPPPSGPPPAYAAVIGKVYPYTLRPVVLFTSLLSFAYLVLLSISCFRDINRHGAPAKLNMYNGIQGGLFLACAMVQVIGFVSAFKSNLKIATLYLKLVPIAFLVLVGAQILGVVVHFTLKNERISPCTTQYTGATATSGWWWGSQTTTFTQQDAQRYCQNMWSNDSTWLIVGLIISIVIGFPFILFSFAFVRQLHDPNLVRVRATPLFGFGGRQEAPSAQYANQHPYDPHTQAYAMNAYPSQPGYLNSAYAPPPGGLGSSGPNQPPLYERGDHAGYDDFDDRKSRTNVADGEGYGHALGRTPSTSRNNDSGQNNAAKESSVSVELARDHGHNDTDRDHGSRI